MASYIGTHGMAHGLDVVLDAGRRLKDNERIVFLLVGDGAERERLLAEKARRGLNNLLMLPQQPKESIPQFLAASDVCLVLLKKRELFKSVIPSKILEAMAVARPIILGVDGESRAIVEAANCGLYVEPENHNQLAEVVIRLSRDQGLAMQLGHNGRKYVEAHFDRDKLAADYLDVLQGVHSARRGIARTISRVLKAPRASRS